MDFMEDNIIHLKIFNKLMHGDAKYVYKYLFIKT